MVTIRKLGIENEVQERMKKKQDFCTYCFFNYYLSPLRDTWIFKQSVYIAYRQLGHWRIKMVSQPCITSHLTIMLQFCEQAMQKDNNIKERDLWTLNGFQEKDFMVNTEILFFFYCVHGKLGIVKQTGHLKAVQMCQQPLRDPTDVDITKEYLKE